MHERKYKTRKESIVSYTYNKAPKNREVLKAIRASITKDIRSNGLSLEEFAHEIGLSEGTLENKLKPSMHTSDITLAEFLHIIDITGDYKALELIAKRYGFILAKSEVSKTEKTDLNTSVMLKTLSLESEQGRFAKVLKEALEDGVLDAVERKKMSDIAYTLRKLALEIEEELKD